MTISTQHISSQQLSSPSESGRSEVEPMEILIREHRVTERALNCLERMAERWTGHGKREKFDIQAVRELVHFFQMFVEAWHFRREEVYFAATGVELKNVEVYEGGDCSFHDHQRCAVHLRGIEQAIGILARGSDVDNVADLDPPSAESESWVSSRPAEAQAAYRAFGEHARAYADILLKHIEDEEDFMYPSIEQRITPDKKLAAEMAFRMASREEIDPLRLDECLATVERLADRFGVLPR